jgi:hypothetical protein
MCWPPCEADKNKGRTQHRVNPHYNQQTNQPPVQQVQPQQIRNNKQLQQARNNAAMQKRLQQQTADNIKNRHR